MKRWLNDKKVKILSKKVLSSSIVGIALLVCLAFFIMLEEKTTYSQDRRGAGFFFSASTRQIIVNGDDRKDYYSISSELKEDADSVAIMVLKEVIDNEKLKTKSLGEVKPQLCSDEPFRNQPTIYHKEKVNRAVCSSFLVAPDVIATAGHCIDTEKTDSSDRKRLSELRFVFGFRMNSATAAGVNAKDRDVYSGKRFIGCSADSDWALIKLDRPVPDHIPVKVSAESLMAGQAVYVIGHPLKLPVKIAGNATVKPDFTELYFKADLDVFGGNSGSPVFSGSNKVIGILVRSFPGEFDYRDTDGSRDCLVSRKCDQDECAFPQSTRTTKLSECLAGFDSPTCHKCFDWNVAQ